MKKTKKILLAAAIVTTAGIISTLIYLSDNQLQSETSYNESIALHLDHQIYGSLDELIKDSPYIFIGTIRDDGRSLIPDTQKEKREEDKTPFTFYSVEINEPIKGDINAKEIVTFQQMGGIYKETRYFVDNYPSLQKGQQYIFFAVGGDGNFGGLAGGYAVALIQESKFALPQEVGISDSKMSISDVRSQSEQ